MARDRQKKQGLSEEDGLFLLTVDDTLKADVIESKLKAYDIPVRRKHRETGAYLTLLLGKSNFGVDFYVPSDRFQEAQEVLASGSEVRDEEILEDASYQDGQSEEADQEILKKLNRQTWLMAAAFFIALGILVYFIFR
ncbi:MAG: hypothetical protein N2376_04030 [Clostridia bacterium]|nr:hypothetical protein [Clostridia bacterium]